VLRAFRTEIIQDLRCSGDDRLATLNLAVQHTQRITVQTAPAILADLTAMRVVIGDEPGDVSRPTDGATRAIELKRQPLKAQPAKEMPGDGHYFHVRCRIAGADTLDVELRVLTVPAGLDPLIAKNRPGAIHPDGLWPSAHPMLNVGAHNARRKLRTQRDIAAALILEGVHLLIHDICALADATDIQPGLLENRNVQALIVVELHHFTDGIIDVEPVRLVLGQDIHGAARRDVHALPLPLDRTADYRSKT